MSSASQDTKTPHQQFGDSTPSETIIKTLGYTPEPDTTDARIIRQGTYWVDRQGVVLEIGSMGANHVDAVIAMLEHSARGMEKSLLAHECMSGVGAGSDHGEEQLERRLAMAPGERMAQSLLMRALLKRQKELSALKEPAPSFSDMEALAAHRVICGATSWDEDHKYGGHHPCWEVARAVVAVARNAAVAARAR
jgi:hypothetical protein